MSDYDAFRKVINHEANQEYDGGFFARLGGLEPDPEDDGPTAKGLFQHMPPRIDFARNSYVYQYDPKIMPKKTWLDHMINAFKAPFNQKPKREPIVKVRAEHISNSYGQLTRWKWECEICPSRNWHATYPAAIAQADRHARNHHRIQK